MGDDVTDSFSSLEETEEKETYDLKKVTMPAPAGAPEMTAYSWEEEPSFGKYFDDTTKIDNLDDGSAISDFVSSCNGVHESVSFNKGYSDPTASINNYIKYLHVLTDYGAAYSDPVSDGKNGSVTIRFNNEDGTYHTVVYGIFAQGVDYYGTVMIEKEPDADEECWKKILEAYGLKEDQMSTKVKSR